MIIDIHSHLGKKLWWPEAEISDYYRTMKLEGVDYGVVFPLPYQLSFENDEQVILKFKVENNERIFASDCLVDLSNPYKKVNQYYFECVNNFKEGKGKIIFVPIIHPILDDVAYLKEIIKNYNPPALKIHGTGSGVTPYDIQQEYIEIVRDSKLPIIVHTDYSRTQENFSFIDKKNDAYSWAMWADKNKIKVCLAHGARLQMDALKIVNESEYVSIGIAPIQRVSRNSNRLEACLDKYEPIEYLEYIRKNVNYRKIMFDLDYNWNRMPDTNEPDYSSSKLVKMIFGEMSDYIFYKNVLDFFDKLSDYIELQ